LSISLGLTGYKSWPHLPKGLEGVARQATLKEVMVVKKKKRAKKARKKHGKEMEIARRVRAGENQSDVEAELESEEPTKLGGEVSTSQR
jgi:hypothetical protein